MMRAEISDGAAYDIVGCAIMLVVLVMLFAPLFAGKGGRR